MKIKKIIAAFCFISCMIFLSTGYGYADDIVVIANIDYPYNAISFNTLKDIYLGDKQMEEGNRIKPVDQRDGKKIKRVFLKKLIGVTHEEYNNYWIGRMFREHGIPPVIKGSPDEVIEFVRQKKGGIGYVWSGEAYEESGIKVIYTIEE